ncbi:MAG: F0F1 ATP synthase subunit B [Candidatus Bostrichicola ureolyticus]|nr:MAG: F0F1 ATP synthase subunit B [Candidatus Bostrichicola ureolyticus]
MDLVTPSIGLFFWQTIIFILLFLILKKFVWKHILKYVEEREYNINKSLEFYRKAKQEINAIKENNNKLLKEAIIKKENILKEALYIKKKLEFEAQENAKLKSEQIINKTIVKIKNEKKNALEILKKEIIQLSIIASEKLLKKELSMKNSQEYFLNKIIDDLK